MRLKAITIAGFLILLAALAQGNFQSANARSSIQTLTFIGEDFASGSGAGYTITSEGLTLADAALTAVYTSPTINVPIPFNAIVPEWDDELPEGANLAIEFRTRKGNGSWSRWYAAHDNADWHEDAADHDEKAGDMVIVPANDVTHDWLQFRVSGGRYTHTAPPLLRQLRFVLIDSSAGPTTAQLIAQQEAQNTAESIQPADANSLPRPAVISRSTWCTQPECNYSDGLDYEPVTNLIMHHTVSSGTGDSAAAVRAIWDYHTFSKGWGDIGYNYLIDLNGVVFEGHLNQDYENLDVIGTHSGDANAGGLGTALIGNFTSPDEGSGIMPTSAMLNALADLFAWKADQRGIDPYDATQMVNVNWGLPNIMGHRDVYGGLNTLCPGGNAYSFLPWLRDAVANRIGYVSPYVYVDETSAAFTKSSVSWYEGPAGCGNNGHSYYTWSTTDPNLSTNWATWVLDVPANGRYRIDIYAPYCDTDRGETFGARYTVNHAAGSNNVTLNHETHIGLWMTLGEFDLATS
ncbi:MAG: hypothetical protein GY796_36425, partial [Chloroflexi bacterium]|nr:hypothetical protein [Chloroflexota bacterium]